MFDVVHRSSASFIRPTTLCGRWRSTARRGPPPAPRAFPAEWPRAEPPSPTRRDAAFTASRGAPRIPARPAALWRCPCRLPPPLRTASSTAWRPSACATTAAGRIPGSPGTAASSTSASTRTSRCRSPSTRGTPSRSAASSTRRTLASATPSFPRRRATSGSTTPCSRRPSTIWACPRISACTSPSSRRRRPAARRALRPRCPWR